MRNGLWLGVLLISTTAAADGSPRTRDGIAAAVRARSGAVAACYEAARAKAPRFEGTFVYVLAIGADGKVTPRAKAATAATQLLDACVVKQLAALRFETGPETIVNYPLVFKADDPTPPPPAGKVAPELAAAFNQGAELARAGKHREALARYREVLAAHAAKKLATTPLFVSTVRLHVSYALIDTGDLPGALKELGLVEPNLLTGAARYDYHFTLGNVHGGMGKLRPMFAALVEAISAAEDLDDYDQRPAVCWTQMLKLTMKAQDWAYLREISDKALQAARLRGMKDLEVTASVARAEANKHLAK